MKGCKLFATGLFGAVALASGSAIAQPTVDPSGNGGRGNNGNGRCALHSDNNRIQHAVYIQFDNVHFRPDVRNVPSDLEQMSNLRNFLVDNGTVLTDHHTIMGLVGLKDDYAHDGRVLFEVLNGNALCAGSKATRTSSCVWRKPTRTSMRRSAAWDAKRLQFPPRRSPVTMRPTHGLRLRSLG
jgi:hypothetical protein